MEEWLNLENAKISRLALWAETLYEIIVPIFKVEREVQYEYPKK